MGLICKIAPSSRRSRGLGGSGRRTVPERPARSRSAGYAALSTVWNRITLLLGIG